MTLVVPDILAEVLKLSFGAQLLGLILGIGLWVTGWWRRSFWVALFVTLGFGIYGLELGRASGTHPLVTALLLGIAAGVLSLELGKLIAFVTGGMASAILVQTFVPTFPEPLLAYLAGGLLCLLVYKLWVLAVFGLSGAALIIYCGLPLIARVLRVNPVDLATQKAVLLNLLLAAGTLVGMLVQSRAEVLITTRKDRQKSKAMQLFAPHERAALETAKPVKFKKRLLGLLPGKQVA